MIDDGNVFNLFEREARKLRGQIVLLEARVKQQEELLYLYQMQADESDYQLKRVRAILIEMLEEQA
jgi:hypothetical protein